jgi:hypothetical protein
LKGKKMKNIGKKIFVLIIAASAIFVGIFAIYSDFKEKKQKEKNKKQQAEEVCKNEKIVKKTLMEAIYYRTGFDYYKPVIILENGKVLEVNKEQFDKAVEGNECRSIFR